MRIPRGKPAAFPARAVATRVGATEVRSANAPLGNLLLSSLPNDDLVRVRRHMESVRLEAREPLFVPDAPISHVYFPETAVISLVSTLADGTAAEVGSAGREGMAGLTLFLAQETSSVTAFTQVPGVAARIGAEAFTRLASVPGALHRLLLHYAEAFLAQVAQTAVCNATHLIEERCARWLLVTHDRVKAESFPLSQEVLAFMLGVRRAGVTLAIHEFQDAGIVRYSRGEVHILDRGKLEGASCDCYRVVRAHFDRLLPPQPAAGMLPNA